MAAYDKEAPLFLRSVTCGVLLSAALATSALAAPPPLSAYGRLPAVEQVAISPDGTRLAMIVTDGDQRNVVIQEIADHKILGGIRAGDTKVRALQWGGSNHVLVTTSSTQSIATVAHAKEEWLQAVDYDVDRKTQHQVMTGVPNAAAILLSDLEVRNVDGHAYAFAQGLRILDERGRRALFRIDVEHGGGTTLVVDGDELTAGWVVDAHGDFLAKTEWDERRGHWALKLRRDGNWHEVMASDVRLNHPDLLGLGRDGHSVILVDADGPDQRVHEFAPAADAWGPALGEGVPSPVYDDATGALIGLHSLAGDRRRYTFFDPADQAQWRAVQKAYPGARITLQSISADHKRLVVGVDTLTGGFSYALIDVAAGTAVAIAATYPEASAAVATVQPIAFKAGDGTPLSGYLTLPNGRDVKNLPLVVLPHGGPAARDTPGFDWWAQALASRGYAVLQVNYRGSDGFDWAFEAAGFGEWGRKMQTDLSDGVSFLAADGRIDPRRVCIVGASYGGYAALAGVSLQPNIYRCAAAVAGLSDLGRFVAWSRDQHSLTTQRYWLRYMGADSGRAGVLGEVSPLAHVAQVTAPVLLVHGRDDSVVPFEQSQLMADALRHAGKSVEFVALAHEDHWLSHGDTRLQMLEAVVAFLEKNNPPG
jgi:dipeptidyl aminopeptidase/acylaminoacyl peptidase